MVLGSSTQEHLSQWINTFASKAREIAKHHNIYDLEASNGWLEKWKGRHNIKKMAVSGELGKVSGKTVDSGKEHLPEIIEGYKRKDIWNIYERWCFRKALPVKGLAQKAKACHNGGKVSKLRLTVAFFVNVSSEKQKAVVIWKVAKPHCFKGIKKNHPPVEYFDQKRHEKSFKHF